MDGKQYSTMPPIAWLRVTDFMHGGLVRELGGTLTVRGKRVLSIQHLKGARHILTSMEAEYEMMSQKPVGKAMSDTWKNCIEAGLQMDPEAVEREYGITKGELDLFLPIECSRMCLTKNGVLRPWTLDVCFGRSQANALMDLLRNEFWRCVTAYDREYARRMDGKRYPAVRMIEDFCTETDTPDIYVDAMRRQWQRIQSAGHHPQS